MEQNSAVKHCPVSWVRSFLPGEQRQFDSRSDSVVRVRMWESFCWKCQEDEHAPVRCDIAKLWIAKNSSESENQNWILSYTKPCPKCSRPIEKNQGCMHMTCSQCRHDFCWTCLEPWSKHSEATGGYYSCNAFRTTDSSDSTKMSEKDEPINEKKRRARMAIERYTHYHERWASHEDAENRAKKKLGNCNRDKVGRCGKKPRR